MTQSAIDERFEGDEGTAFEQLESHLQSRLRGHVLDLRVIKSSAGIVLQGRATSFYAKQLAQQEFKKATARPLLANEILVLQ
jgi:hypothetical protein